MVQPAAPPKSPPRPPTGPPPLPAKTEQPPPSEPQVAPPAAMLLEGLRATVQSMPDAQRGDMPVDSIVMYIASIADVIPPWGTQTLRRDRMLREFFIREPMLGSAVYSVGAANSSYKWMIESEDEDLAAAVTEMLEVANFGEGWSSFVSGITTDLSTQDRGAFIEIIREKSSPDSPVLGIASIEALRCRPTGNPKKPVLYTDEKGKDHLLNYWDVARVVEMPSTVATMRGMQYCAVSRVLAAAQIMRDIVIYRGEKVGGRFTRMLHIVGGPAKQDIKRALQAGKEDDDNEGMTRFSMPTILASLDPSKPVSHVEIPLASLPDNFDLEDEMKWYLTTLSMAFGRDYQDFAPLPGGNLGSSGQSEVLAAKTKGKAPAVFMRSMEFAMNRRGVVPFPLAKFRWKELDLEDEGAREKIRRLRAETRAALIKSGEITPEVARLMAVKDGDYDAELIPQIEQYEAEARKRSEENLRLNAELNADVRQTVAGRTANTSPQKPPKPPGKPGIAGAKKDMKDLDTRRELESVIPLAAIVHSLRQNKATEALVAYVEKALAGQAAGLQVNATLVDQVRALAKAARETPPVVNVAPVVLPPAEVNVTLPTQAVNLEVSMPATEETTTVERDANRLVRSIRKIIKPLTPPSVRAKP